MNLFQAPAFAATAAVASILAAAVLTLPVTPSWRPAPHAATPEHLGCQIEVRPGQSTLLRLVNTGRTTLPAGARFSWVTLGTPSPRGEVRQLPHSLAPGDTLSLASTRTASGVGCAAVLFDD